MSLGRHKTHAYAVKEEFQVKQRAVSDWLLRLMKVVLGSVPKSQLWILAMMLF